MINAVGGTSIHWMTQSWRFLPWNFKTVSMSKTRYGPNAIPKDSTSIDWPFDFAELEPYYDKHEYFAGVSGQAGNIQGTIDPRGNIFEGPRRRGYPLPPLRSSGFTDMMDAAAKSASWHPYPGPAGIRSKAYRGKAGCTYCGFCGSTGCYTNAKVQTNVDYIPSAEKTKNLKVVPLADALTVEVDDQGRASGVLYLKNGREYFQPAKVVVVAGYTYGNVRLLLLSTSKAYPNGLSNNHGQVGRHYIAHGLGSAGATGWFPGKRLNRYSGTLGQFVGVRRPRRRQLRPLRARLHRRRDVQRHDGGEADRHREHDAAERPALGLELEVLAGAERRLGCRRRRAARGAVLRGQLPRPRPGGPRSARPAGDPDHERLPRQREAPLRLRAGEDGRVAQGRRCRGDLDGRTGCALAEHARLRRHEDG